MIDAQNALWYNIARYYTRAWTVSVEQQKLSRISRRGIAALRLWHNMNTLRGVIEPSVNIYLATLRGVSRV